MLKQRDTGKRRNQWIRKQSQSQSCLHDNKIGVIEQEENRAQVDNIKIEKDSWGTWVVQSVELQTSVQVMTSQLVSLSPASGLLLSAELASDPLSPSFSALPLLVLSLKKHKKKGFHRYSRDENAETDRSILIYLKT